VDANAVAMIGGSLAGGLIGAPAGFFIERFFTRPRVHVGHAEVCYEDGVSLPVQLQTDLLMFGHLMAYVDSRVHWGFERCVRGNFFTIQEFRVVHELALQYRDLQEQQRRRIDSDLLALGGEQVDAALLVRLAPVYREHYRSALMADLRAETQKTLVRVKEMMGNERTRSETEDAFVNSLIAELAKKLGPAREFSEHLIVRAAVGNQGYQDAIVATEARLVVGNKSFRLPLRLGSRTSDQSHGSSIYSVIKAKSLQLIEYAVDESLNASADVTTLRQELKRHKKVKLQLFGLAGRVATTHGFDAVLPD
jgi:hypothetical protein